MSPSRTTIVSVSYNSSGVIAAMLGSCLEAAGVIVVDNASDDAEVLAALCDEHGAQMIGNDENLGFGAACNIGAAAVMSEFILFLNPDAHLEPDTLSQLERCADAHPETAAFNPMLYDAQGQHGIKRKSDLISRSEYIGHDRVDQQDDMVSLSGAAIFIRRQDFENIAGFDPNIFLFFEDDDLAARVRQSGRGLRLCREAVVRHIVGTGSGPSSHKGSATKAWYMGFSRLYTMRKHGRPFARMRTIGKAILRVLDPSVLVSKGRRMKRFAYLRGTLAALREAGK